MSEQNAGGYRDSSHCIPGFNLVTLDVDSGVSIRTVQLLLANFTYYIYTTKRHTVEDNRFRIVMLLSHKLKLNEEGYKDFMVNVFRWLPFECDEQTGQRSRKWLTNPNAEHFTHQGKMLDAQLFIQNSTKHKQYNQVISDLGSMQRVERWFMGNTQSGNRSNNLVRYAFMLVDSGMSLESIQTSVLNLNERLPDKISEAEILRTVMTSVNKKLIEKAKGVN